MKSPWSPSAFALLCELRVSALGFFAVSLPYTRVFVSCLLALPSFSVTSQAQESRRRPAINWRDAQAPLTPGIGAIIGGPGNSPAPGGPNVHLPHTSAGQRHSRQMGEWLLQGGVQRPGSGDEPDQVAYGDAVWQPYSGQFPRTEKSPPWIRPESPGQAKRTTTCKSTTSNKRP
jgi:hypothetical protein